MKDKAKRIFFAFLGDPQCDRLSGDDEYNVWRGILSRAAFELSDSGEDPLLVIAGDLVNHTRDEREWAAFFKAGGNYFARAKVITPTGNHDRSRAYDKKFDLPSDGPAGLERRFYTYDHGCIRFIVLDTNHLETSDPVKKSKIRCWLADRLKGEAVPPVRIVVMHHPMFSLGSSLDDEVRASVMRKNYLDVMEEGGVGLILCGHQHVYCRTAAGSAAGGGIPQIMSVSGGKHHSPRNADKMECVLQDISVVTIVDTDGTDIHIRTLDVYGEVLDEWTGTVNRPDAAALNRTGSDAGSFPLDGGIQAKGSGIRISGPGITGTALLTDDEIMQYQITGVTYSHYRRDHMDASTFCGYEMTELLKAAGWDGSGTGIKLTTSDGYDMTMRLDSLLTSWAFDKQGQKTNEVPALLIKEEKPGCMRCSKADSCEKEKTQWGLVFGQQHPRDRVGRKWVHGLAAVEIVDIAGLVGEEWASCRGMTGNDGAWYDNDIDDRGVL